MGKGRAPCCAKVGLNKGSWTPEEDMRLVAYIQKYGHANWRALPKQAGLLRCGKSCRLRWINYLRPDLKRGNFTAVEEETIIKLHAMLGNKWSKITACLPGRTDNEIKNVWNTHLKKRAAPPRAGEQDHAAAKKKKKKIPSAAGAEATVPSPSTASSTTTATTNFSSGADSGAEQQSNKEPEEELVAADLNSLDDIPMLDTAGFDFDDMLVDPVPELYSSCPSTVSVPASPFASSTSPPPAAPPNNLLDLPEFEIDQELWSIIDGPFTPAPALPPCHANAAEANAATTTSQEEDGKEWWLENLERELGLWGPVEDYQYPTGPLGLAHPDPLPAVGQAQDPVTCYFQTGPNPATFQGDQDDAAILRSSST